VGVVLVLTRRLLLFDFAELSLSRFLFLLGVFFSCWGSDFDFLDRFFTWGIFSCWGSVFAWSSVFDSFFFGFFGIGTFGGVFLIFFYF